jgi:hypothetical protein
MDNSHSLKQDKNNHTYRINVISLNNEKLLAQTEFSADREAVIYLTDLINTTPGLRGKIRAQVETRGTGFAHVG